MSNIPARTWIVLRARTGPVRTESTDDLAWSAAGGLAYKDPLPPYLGLWLAPNGGEYHLYSDYPEQVYERFGWTKKEPTTL